MTKDNCRKRLAELLSSLELDKTIEALLNTKMVAEMLDDPEKTDYVTIALLSAAIKMQYERFRPLSAKGKSIEEELMNLL